MTTIFTQSCPSTDKCPPVKPAKLTGAKLLRESKQDQLDNYVFYDHIAQAASTLRPAMALKVEQIIDVTFPQDSRVLFLQAWLLIKANRFTQAEEKLQIALPLAKTEAGRQQFVEPVSIATIERTLLYLNQLIEIENIFDSWKPNFSSAPQFDNWREPGVTTDRMIPRHQHETQDFKAKIKILDKQLQTAADDEGLSDEAFKPFLQTLQKKLAEFKNTAEFLS